VTWRILRRPDRSECRRLAGTITGCAPSPALLFAARFLVTFSQEDAVSVPEGRLSAWMVIDPVLAMITPCSGLTVAALFAAVWFAPNIVRRSGGPVRQATVVVASGA
jgi:hypothetical protein